MTSAENDRGGQEYVGLPPAQIHPNLCPSIHTRLELVHPLYLCSAACAEYALGADESLHPVIKRSPAGCWTL